MSRHLFYLFFLTSTQIAIPTRYYKRKNVVSVGVMVGKSVINLPKMVRKSVDVNFKGGKTGWKNLVDERVW